MKWLFGFLLVLSIILFSLIRWGGELTGDAKNGQTLAELNPEKIKLLDLTPPLKTPGSTVLPVQPAAAVSAPVDAAPMANDMSPASAPSAVSAPLHAPAMEKSTVSAPAGVSGTLPAPTPPLRISAAAPGAAVKAASCMEWGEFSGTDLARATKALAALNLGDRLAQRTAEYASGYWVYIPPLENKAAVNRKIAQFKALGVEDYFVVPEPKGTYMISLGVFKTHEAAKNYLVTLQKKGVRPAKVGERKRILKFTVFEIKRVDSTAAVRLAALQKEFKGSELKSLSCKK